ncbi:MAG: hypothetical protein Q8O74_08540, partial [bacterium]|nr:hypothetical protein [bacterium]
SAHGDWTSVGALPSCLFMKSLLVSIVHILGALVICALVFLVALYLYQDKMIFYPQKISLDKIEYISKLANVEGITIRTKDGFDIKGWYIGNNSADRSKILLYFGGNAEEVSYMIPEVTEFKNCSIVLMNYRGYGQSQGKPNENNLCGDALVIYDYFIGRPENKDSKIIIMGRSIGTGVAVFLAKNRRCNGVVLVSPYNDFKSLAQYHFPYLPVGPVIKYKFNSGERVPSIKSPLMIMLGTGDKTIPPEQSRLLAQKWGGRVTIKEFEGADHNNLSTYREYWKFINDFIGTI